MNILSNKINLRADELLNSQEERLYKRTDKLFAGLFIFQWLASIFVALVVSPRTWNGLHSSIHPHVYIAVGLVGIVSLLPIFLIIIDSGSTLTRHVVAVSQILISSLLIHLTGGRLETHFHIFGSLAFLAFYRDWKIFILPTMIIAIDHYVRGVYWPESVFGVLAPDRWRWLEHTGWVLFEDCFLINSCLGGVREMRAIADRTAQLELTNQNIEKIVIERTKELKASQEKLETASKYKDTFLANMSHEIRTPLNGILGVSSLLNETSLNEKQIKYVNIINQSGKILLDVISDVLEFSKVQENRLELYKTEFNFRELMLELVNIMQYAASKKKIKLICEIGPNIPNQLIGDSFRIKQLIINLLNNAIKFTEKGEVKLIVKSKAQSRLEKQMFPLEIIVADTGIGIPQDKWDIIFEPFLQVDSSLTRTHGGTGLGLSIVKKVLALMQGSITVNSSVGVGSQFIIKLALEKPAFQKKLEATAVSTSLSMTLNVSPIRSMNILVAEDNLSNQFVIEELLTRLGCKVIMTSNGQEAIVKLDHEHIDLCLMDIQMPVMDGMTATRKIRRSQHKDLPIIALTASVFDVNRQECFDAGVDDFLEKPVHINDLREMLEKWLNKQKNVVKS